MLFAAYTTAVAQGGDWRRLPGAVRIEWLQISHRLEKWQPCLKPGDCPCVAVCDWVRDGH